MSIEATRVVPGSRRFKRYLVTATPHADPAWHSESPISRRAAEKKLYELGNHTADIAEAFAAADDAGGDRSGRVSWSRLFWPVSYARIAPMRLAYRAVLAVVVTSGFAGAFVLKSADGSGAYSYDSPSSVTTPTVNTRVDTQRADDGHARISRTSTSSIAGFVATKGGSRRLYRAVGPDEAADIRATGSFRGSPTGSESKHFYGSLRRRLASAER